MNKCCYLTIKSVICGVFLMYGITSNACAWGPADRPTYTNENPADFATFNSITNNAAVGDERNFVRVREFGTDQKYADEVEVVPGKEYEVFIYFHNDAASNTNATGFGVAMDSRVASAYPTVLNPGERGMISGLIYWNYVMPGDGENAREGSVWDEAYLTTKSENTILRYKPGTAIIHNGGDADGSILSESLFTESGTLIGYNKLTGIIPGCAEYSGYITYILVAELTDAELEYVVSTDGENWGASAAVVPGEYATFRVTFKNTGNTTMTNVIFKNIHSDDLILRTGSTKVFDYENTSGKQIDDIIDLSGYNVGDVYPGATVTITFQAQLNRDTVNSQEALSSIVSTEYNGVIQQNPVVYVLVDDGAESVTENERNIPTVTIPIIAALLLAVGFGVYRRRKSGN